MRNGLAYRVNTVAVALDHASPILDVALDIKAARQDMTAAIAGAGEPSARRIPVEVTQHPPRDRLAMNDMEPSGLTIGCDCRDTAPRVVNLDGREKTIVANGLEVGRVRKFGEAIDEREMPIPAKPDERNALPGRAKIRIALSEAANDEMAFSHRPLPLVRGAWFAARQLAAGKN
jgi:hypothetical protein